MLRACSWEQGHTGVTAARIRKNYSLILASSGLLTPNSYEYNRETKLSVDAQQFRFHSMGLNPSVARTDILGVRSLFFFHAR